MTSRATKAEPGGLTSGVFCANCDEGPLDSWVWRRGAMWCGACVERVDSIYFDPEAE